MKTFKNDQSGRSMIEMLAVLAIIGILSIAGIAGYSKAMGKYKEQKLGDQISMLTANIRTTYASQANYANITNAIAATYGLVPADMLTGTAGEIRNSMGGTVVITASTDAQTGVANAGFSVTFSGLNKSSCVYIATSDWGFGTSGLVAMSVAKKAGGTGVAQTTPLSLATAETNCACETSSSCEVNWVYL